MNKPKVSVVIAVRDEEKTIKQCIESLLAQNYSSKEYEIIFADGCSKDKTKEIIREYAKRTKNPKIILLNNPAKDSGSGRNIGIKKACGKYIVQLSGHTVAKKNLLKTLIGKLEKAGSEVAGVGCVHRTPKDAPFLQHVFGTTMSTLIGGMGTSHIQASKDKFVESVSFTAYKKEVLEEVGLNDPHFKIGQDAELNIRIRKAGYKLLYTPSTHVLYYKRSSYSKFFMQMYKYGFARAKIIQKHPSTRKFYYLGPSTFVILLILLLIGSLYSEFILFFFTLFMIVYIGILASFSILNSKSIRFAIAMFFAFFIEHLAYGLGFLIGIVRKFK